MPEQCGAKRGMVDALVFSPTPMGIFQQSLALQERGALQTMAVNAYFDLRASPWRLVRSTKFGRFLGRRFNPMLDTTRVRTNPLIGLYCGLSQRFQKNKNKAVFLQNHLFDRWVSKHLPEWGTTVIGYESASLETFRRAKSLGLPCILYQPIACAESALELLAEEARLFPALAGTLRYNWFPEDELQRRKEERLLADAIICATSFTRDSLVANGVPVEKIRVVGYGVDQRAFTPRSVKSDKFTIVWASAHTQTKGLGYLLEALAQNPVPGAELILAGYRSGADAATPYEGRVRIRRVGRVSRGELARLLAESHAHVFPTIVEGFGRNIIEAMAAGVPVITTRNCAGPDLIEDGVSGFIVPIRDPAAICDRLRWLSDNPVEAAQMAGKARDRVRGLTEEDYRTRFASEVEAIVFSLRAAQQHCQGRSELRPFEGTVVQGDLPGIGVSGAAHD